MTKFKMSAVASLAIIGATFGLSGCGSSDSSTATAAVASIAGTVSDGPIKNARVFIDENFDGEYTPGEPMAFTDENGKYTLDFVPEDGVEYLLVAEGNAALGTEDLEDNPTAGQALTFTMFSNSKSSSDLNPTTFKTYLQSIETEVGENAFISGYLTATDATDTLLFQNQIKDKVDVVKNALKVVAHKYKADTLTTTKEDLGLDEQSQIAFAETATTAAQLDAQPQYQDKVVSQVGNLVVSKKIIETPSVEVDTIDDTAEGITINSVSATNAYYDGDTTNSPIALKKPIFSSINDKTDKVKLVVGKKTALTGDNTVSITPYDNILEIPAYEQIKTLGYSVVVGSHIVVQDSNGEKRPISEMNDILVSGAVLHKNDGLTLSGLKYLYFDGTNWVDENISGADTFNGLSSNFKLVPYVLVEADTTTNGLTEQTIEVPGLSLINNPVVVAKGKANSTSSAKLMLQGSEEDNLILDASLDITGDNVVFKVPTGYTIEELVIIDEDLNRLTQKASIKTTVGEGIDVGLTLATAEQEQSLLSTFEQGLGGTAFEAFDLFSFQTAQTAEEEAFNAILKENFKRFLMSSTTANKDEFYNPTTDNKILFSEEYQSYGGTGMVVNTTECTISTNTISCSETEVDNDVTVGTGTYSLTFTAGKLVASGSWNESESYNETNYSSTDKFSDSVSATYLRQGLDYVSTTFTATYGKNHVGSYAGESSYSMTQNEKISGVAHFKLVDAQIAYVNSAKYNLDVKGTSTSEGSPSSFSVNGVSTYLRDSSLDTQSYTNDSGIFKFEGSYYLPAYVGYDGYSMIKGETVLNGTYIPGVDYYDNGYILDETITDAMFKIESVQEVPYSYSSSSAPAKQN